MFLVIPFLVLVDLGAFYVLVLGVATLAHILPEQEGINMDKGSVVRGLWH